MNWSKPVFILGQGIRAAGVDPSCLLDTDVPILTSWSAKDLVDNWHPNYFGCPGNYGQRVANKVLYEADTVIAIGCRLPIWTVGWSGIKPSQKLLMVDCDAGETKRFPHAEHIGTDIREFIEEQSLEWPVADWLTSCKDWKAKYPLLEQGTHDDAGGYINSYLFTARFEGFLKDDAVIVVDAGCCMCPTFQVLRVKPPQRILHSGGLGEMGSSLPGAIGASFARNKGEVLCIVGDGGFMLNIQELQTVVHHQLPIKIIVYRNNGYAMIRHSQGVLGLEESGVSPETGLSFPDFVKVARAFGLIAWDVRSWADYHSIMPMFFGYHGPALIQYWQHPMQKALPKLNPVIADGKIGNPEFWDLSPRLAA